MYKLFISVLLMSFIILLQGCGNSINEKNFDRNNVKSTINGNVNTGNILSGDYISTGQIVSKLGNLNFDEILPILEKKYKLNPDSVFMYANALNMKASLSFGKERVKLAEKSEKIIKKGLEKNENNTELWRILGYSYELRKDYKKAENAYKKSLEINKKNYLTYASLGHLYMLIGDYKKAEINLNQAKSKNMGDDYVIINLANLYLIKKDYKKAELLFKKVLNISDNNQVKAEASYNLGNIYYKNKEYGKAIKYYKYAIEYNPKFDLGYVGLSKVYFSNFLKSLKDNKKNYKLYQKSIDYINKAIYLNPNRVYTYYTLGLQYKTLGAKKQAKEYFKKGLNVINKDTSLLNEKKIFYKDILTKYINNL